MRGGTEKRSEGRGEMGSSPRRLGEVATLSGGDDDSGICTEPKRSNGRGNRERRKRERGGVGSPGSGRRGGARGGGGEFVRR